MVNNKLLKSALEEFENEEVKLTPVKYEKDMFLRLFDKFNNYEMYEYSCNYHSLESIYLTDVIGRSCWNLSLEDIKYNICYDIKRYKKYLYNTRKYGGCRIYKYEDNDYAYIYIYLRDKLEHDYYICFSKIN